MDELSDADLARLWAAGSSEAGNELIGRYFDDLRAFLINSVPDQDCADVLQDVFARVTTANQHFNHQSSFRTYLYRIAHNTVADYFRSRYRRTFDPSSDSVEDIVGLSPSTAVAELQAARRLNACLRRLSVDERAMIELRYWHDFSFGEIADMFDAPEPTIRTRLFRARKKLEKLLTTCLEEAERAEILPELDARLHELGFELGIPRRSM